jgi:hypothetical protein
VGRARDTVLIGAFLSRGDGRDRGDIAWIPWYPSGVMMERTRKQLMVISLSASLLLLASPALGDEYESQSAGHPLRIVAYVLHPIGVTLDYLIFRPAHWIGSLGPLKTFFGHSDETPRISEPKRTSNPRNPDGTRETSQTP